MTDKWQKLASLAQEICTLWFQFLGAVFASKGYPFKNIFDFTTAGDWDCVAAVERLPALHYSVDFIFLSFGIMGYIVGLETIRGSLMKSKWQLLASLAQEICTPGFNSLVQSLLPRDTILRTYLTSLQLVTGTVWQQ